MYICRMLVNSALAPGYINHEGEVVQAGLDLSLSITEGEGSNNFLNSTITRGNFENFARK